jgi:hypothetical protein
MELQKIGLVPLDWDKLIRFPEAMRPGTSAAINDISIANSFRKVSLTSANPKQSIARLGEILSD